MSDAWIIAAGIVLGLVLAAGAMVLTRTLLEVLGQLAMGGLMGVKRAVRRQIRRARWWWVSRHDRRRRREFNELAARLDRMFLEQGEHELVQLDPQGFALYTWGLTAGNDCMVAFTDVRFCGVPVRPHDLPPGTIRLVGKTEPPTALDESRFSDYEPKL